MTAMVDMLAIKLDQMIFEVKEDMKEKANVVLCQDLVQVKMRNFFSF